MAYMIEERLDDSWRGLKQMVKPDDDPDNVANHFSVDRVYPIVKYTHHLLTLGAFRDLESLLITLYYLHYTTPSPSLRLLSEAIAQGYFSIAEVKIHKAVIREKVGDGMIIGMTILSDEGKLLKECLKGKICRIRRSSYPTDDDDKITAVERALERCGEKAYKVSLNNCEHLVTEILTGTATSLQAEDRVGTAVSIDSTICKIPVGAIKMFIKRLPELMLKLGSVETPMIRAAFLDLFSSGLDDGIQYMVKGAATTGKEVGQIVARSGINFLSAAVVELSFLIGHTIYDIYSYKRGRKTARLIAQNFLQGIAGLVGTALGTMLGGLLGALLLAPFGLSAGGLIGGNIIGGVVGGIIVRKFGTKWLTNGRIEAKLVKTIEAKYKVFAVEKQPQNSALLQQINSLLLSSRSVSPLMLRI